MFDVTGNASASVAIQPLPIKGKVQFSICAHADPAGGLTGKQFGCFCDTLKQKLNTIRRGEPANKTPLNDLAAAILAGNDFAGLGIMENRFGRGPAVLIACSDELFVVEVVFHVSCLPICFVACSVL